jgi:hypothetical protein
MEENGVCYGAGGDDATTKGTSGLQAKHSTWFLDFQCCVINFGCGLIIILGRIQGMHCLF